MHVHFEQSATTRSDCTVHALSWMGKVPDSLPEDEGWKLNRLQYYQEGWLASGNSRGIVGVTFTACHCKKQFDCPPRANFNLRGHRNEVVLVKWNEPYQKLATCDSTGVIFVWIKHEGRWSIELINDRNSQVTDFAWSHDGRMALICYRDGFVLVGSVAGQRYWSSMLNLDTCMITCGIWSPDDTKVLFGTTDGQMIVMSSTGAMLLQVTICDGQEISTISYSCEKFHLDEQDNDTSSQDSQSEEKNHVLAVCFKSGIIYIMSNYDDPCPRVINTGLQGIKMEWCNDGEVLTVGGFVRSPNLDCSNELLFYTPDASLRYKLCVPNQGKPITALTWGHNNKRLYVAAGCHIFTAWVTKKVALLQYLCRRAIHSMMREETHLEHLPLPTKLRNAVAALFVPTIKGYIPDPLKLREFVCVPPPHNERLHCTMIRHGDENSAGQYTLYLEYLGGLIPLLKGKRHSKIRPEFVIYDPKIKLNGRHSDEGQTSQFVSSDSDITDTDSDADMVGEGCGSPRMQRKRRQRKQRDRLERRDSSTSSRPLDELLYDDNLPEVNALLEVTSNIWGTKFKINGIASYLPQDLGQVLYKTSLLHLQPRQMTITILELGTDLQPLDRDPGYSPNNFSESDDEYVPGQQGFQETVIDGATCPMGDIPVSPEICVNPHRLSTIQGSTDTLGPQIQDSSAMEVPVVVEKHAAFQTLRVDKSSPLEIRSLEGSPPQRRSPSLKSRSLSPAEPFAYTSNSLVDGNIADCADMFTREMYLDKGAVPKIKMNSNNLTLNGAADVDSDTDLPCSPHSVVQLAAKKLEDVMQRHRCLENGNMMMSIDERSHDAPRWADRAVHEIKYIDDEADADLGEHSRAEHRDAVFCSQDALSAREIMRSTQMLADINNTSTTEAAVTEPSSSSRKRVVLAPSGKGKSKDKSKQKKEKIVEKVKHKVKGHHRGGSVDFLLQSHQLRSADDSSDTPSTSATNSPVLSERHVFDLRRGSLEMKRIGPRQDKYCQGIDSSQSASLPTSPVRRIVQPQAKRAKSKQDVSSFRSRLTSPLSGRRLKNYKAVDSSDDEVVMSGDEIMLCHNYKNLETFQKAQLTRKLRKARTKTDGDCREVNSSPKIHRRRHFVMHNKAPLWNENSQVYQLDFGGRVTQESAKNFQIEFMGKQVMQFGRIDTNAYTLDFQYPFCAIQAFAVALANITQRLK